MGITYANQKCDISVIVVLELKCGGLMHYHVAVYCLFSTTTFAGIGDVIENVMDYVCMANAVPLPLSCGGE